MNGRDALRDRVERAVGALFSVEEEIGRGGMAVVYRARDVRLRRKVALKVLPPELAFRDDVKSRFLREAQMSAQLSHPNIVPIYAVDELDGIVFFAMGLVEGETLAQQLVHSPRPDVETVRRVLREVADALAYAHANHVVHRDVKPDNILMEAATGRALVSDFGIARAAEGDSRLTVTGIAVGTPAYMSPEQAMGERDVDGRADIYSLGIVGYQMLAGELPHQAANTPAMLMKHISERPRPLRELRTDLPKNLVAAIERAMAKGRDDRWPDASAFRDALAAGAAVGPSVRTSQRPSATDGGADSALERLRAQGANYAPNEPDRREFGLPIFPERINSMLNSPSQGYNKNVLREWRDQQREWRKEKRGELDDMRQEARFTKRDLKDRLRDKRANLTPEERIRRVQRSILGYVGTTGMLASINLLTAPNFLWFLFPAIGMGFGVVSKVSSLWIDGIPLRRLFTRQPMTEPVAATQLPESRGVQAPLTAPRIASADLAGIPREVLDGPHGAAIRDAAESKAVIIQVLAGLSPADREMLPEIRPTVDTLVERVRSLAQTLHQLDSDASPEALARLDQRVAAVRATPEDAPDRDRRLQLLERQQVTLKDLARHRDANAQQMESASLILQTIKLDLFKLRSSNVDAKLDASTGATQEARALSKDIGRVIEAANEVRRL